MPTVERLEPTGVPAAAPLSNTPAPKSTDVPTSNANGSTLPPKTYKLKDVAITLERTVCFGSCPAYEVTIQGDGTVNYNGMQFVKVTGTQTKKISPEAVVALLREFYKMDFFILRNEYTAQRDIDVAADGTVQEIEMHVTDLPSMDITLHLGDYTKRVHAYSGAPEWLYALGQKIDATAGTAEWIR